MHWGCLMWTPPHPFPCRRTPRPGPARVCLCVLFVAGSDGPACRARCGAPHLSCGHLCFFFARPPPGWGCPCLFYLLFSLPCPACALSLFAPPTSLVFGALQPRVPCALALCVFSFPAPPSCSFLFCFFFLAASLLLFSLCAVRPSYFWLWRSLVAGLGCPWPWRCAVSLPPHPCVFLAPFFFVFPPCPPPRPPLCALCLVLPAVAVCCAACCAACPPRAVVGCCASGVLCRAVPCCWFLLCAVSRFRSPCPAPLFPLWLAVSSLVVLPRAVPCPRSLCCTALPCAVLLSAGLLCLALFGAAACCVVPSGFVRRPGVLCLLALCFFMPRRALCSARCAFCP